jgi:cysteate synthase
MLAYDDDLARRHVEEIDAKVLSNRRPPYSLAGGLYDAMKDAGGDVLLADNTAAREAAKLFNELEGNDIHPAAAIATATLIEEAKENRLDNDALIMLNITGGGEERFQKEHKLHYLKPSLIFDIDPDEDEVKEKLSGLF